MPTSELAAGDVELWNDTFAREHDIDDYYARSGLAIRWIERKRIAQIHSMTAAEPSDRILEIGCGGGHVLQQFPDSDLTGVDVSGEMLAKARCNLRGYRVRLLKGELQELELPDAGFDKIICTEVLEHTLDPEGILSQMRRLVRSDGRIVVTLPNDPLVNRVKGFIRKTHLTILPPFRRISWGGDQYHLHTWRVGQMRELLSRHFVIVRQRFIPNRLLPVRCCFHCALPS